MAEQAWAFYWGVVIFGMNLYIYTYKGTLFKSKWIFGEIGFKITYIQIDRLVKF